MIYRGMMQFMVIQCIAVALVLAFPGIATWLPEALEDKPGASQPAFDGDSSADERNVLEAGDTMAPESEPPRGNGD